MEPQWVHITNNWIDDDIVNERKKCIGVHKQFRIDKISVKLKQTMKENNKYYKKFFKIKKM